MVFKNNIEINKIENIFKWYAICLKISDKMHLYLG